MSTELTPEQEKQVQAQVLEERYATGAWVLQMMKAHFGEEACQVVEKTLGEQAFQHGKKTAEEIGDNSLEAYIKYQLEFARLAGDELECTVEETESGFQMKYTKCKMADTAKRLGAADEVFYFSCACDKYGAEGFNPNIGLKLTKTLMQGDECCDHFYYYKDKNK